jgi:hypothetical protein
MCKADFMESFVRRGASCLVGGLGARNRNRRFVGHCGEPLGKRRSRI